MGATFEQILGRVRRMIADRTIEGQTPEFTDAELTDELVQAIKGTPRLLGVCAVPPEHAFKFQDGDESLFEEMENVTIGGGTLSLTSRSSDGYAVTKPLAYADGTVVTGDRLLALELFATTIPRASVRFDFDIEINDAKSQMAASGLISTLAKLETDLSYYRVVDMSVFNEDINKIRLRIVAKSDNEDEEASKLFSLSVQRLRLDLDKWRASDVQLVKIIARQCLQQIEAAHVAHGNTDMAMLCRSRIGDLTRELAGIIPGTQGNTMTPLPQRETPTGIAIVPLIKSPNTTRLETDPRKSWNAHLHRVLGEEEPYL